MNTQGLSQIILKNLIISEIFTIVISRPGEVLKINTILKGHGHLSRYGHF